jgi:hypothetical protein
MIPHVAGQRLVDPERLAQGAAPSDARKRLKQHRVPCDEAATLIRTHFQRRQS